MAKEVIVTFPDIGIRLLRAVQNIVLTNYSRLEVDENGPGYVLSSSSLGEKSVERVITSSNSLVRWHLAIGLNAVLQAVQLPAGITDLNASLSNVDRNTLPHVECKKIEKLLSRLGLVKERF